MDNLFASIRKLQETQQKEMAYLFAYAQELQKQHIKEMKLMNSYLLQIQQQHQIQITDLYAYIRQQHINFSQQSSSHFYGNVLAGEKIRNKLKQQESKYQSGLYHSNTNSASYFFIQPPSSGSDSYIQYVSNNVVKNTGSQEQLHHNVGREAKGVVEEKKRSMQGEEDVESNTKSNSTCEFGTDSEFDEFEDYTYSPISICETVIVSFTSTTNALHSRSRRSI